MRQGTAVYVGANGEAIADYRLFKNAYQASVIDASGKQADVDCILGADDTYSMVRFRVNTKGNAVIPIVTSFQPMKSTVFSPMFDAVTVEGVVAVTFTPLNTGEKMSSSVSRS